MGITIDLPEDLIKQADRLGLHLDPATVKALLTESLDAKLAVLAAAAEAEDPAAYEAWFRQAVAEGIADADAGRDAPVDVVRKRVLGGR
jgi:predicted transcriptional regulator